MTRIGFVYPHSTIPTPEVRLYDALAICMYEMTRRLARGTYRYTLRLQHPVNPAPPTLRRGPAFRLP